MSTQVANDIDPRMEPWRTLVTVESVDHDHGCIHVLVPPWHARQTVRIELNNLPREIRDLVAVDRYFHAYVNTGAERAEDLVFTRWETS